MSLTNYINLNERRSLFDKFLLECNPVLFDFASLLELNAPEGIIYEPDVYFEVIDEYLTNQIIEYEDRPWLLVRLVYLFAIILNNRVNTRWVLESKVKSSNYGRFILRIHTASGLSTDVDLFSILQKYVGEPSGRSLRKYLDEVSMGL